MTQEVMKLALEALQFAYNHCDSDWVQYEKINPAITAIKEALAQTQEPVVNDPLPRACALAGVDYQTFLKIKAYMPVAPPQRSESSGKPSAWVGLTDEDICTFSMWLDDKSDVAVFTAIEAKLKELNI